MAKNNNLTDFLTDIADSIRFKKGTNKPIDPQDFSTEIINIGGQEDSSLTVSYILAGNLVGMEVVDAPYTVNLASGNAYSTISLSGYSVQYRYTDSDTPVTASGVLAFKTPSEVPVVGTHKPILIFTPTDPTDYNEGATQYEIWDAITVVVS